LVSSVEPSDSGQEVATPTLTILARIYKIGVTRILILVRFMKGTTLKRLPDFVLVNKQTIKKGAKRTNIHS
jgi:hypothetical protein